MRRSISILTGLALVAALPAVTAAQPGSEPAPPPPQTRPATPVDTQNAGIASYRAGFDAMLRGDLDGAIAQLRIAIGLPLDPSTAAAARELLRLATQMKQRGIRITGVAGPTGPSPAASDAKRAAEDRVAGRTTFIISTTMASVWTGAILIDLLDVGDDFRPSVALITGTTALGVIGSYYGSKGRTITEGMGDSYTLGLTLGAANGLLLASPFGFDDSSEEFQTFALASLVAGGAGGLLLSDAHRPPRGQVSFINTTSILGVASTFLGLAIIQPDDLDADTWLMLTAGGLDIGAGLGISMAKDLDWSLARARLVALGAFLGAFSGWAAGALMTGADFDEDSDSDARLWASSTLIGMWGGVGLTWHLTRNMRPDWRFRDKAPKQPTVVMPTMVGRDAPGLAVSGSF